MVERASFSEVCPCFAVDLLCLVDDFLPDWLFFEDLLRGVVSLLSEDSVGSIAGSSDLACFFWDDLAIRGMKDEYDARGVAQKNQ